MGTLVTFLVCLNLFYYFGIVQSVCILNYPINIETVPRYEKYIGKYKIQIPYNGNEIHLQDGEILNGFCDTFFSSFYCVDKRSASHYDGYDYNPFTNENNHHLQIYHYNKTSIALTCKKNELIYYDLPLGETVLECAKTNWTVYTTEETYLWCEKNLNSSTFLLATKPNEHNYILAGICYNLETLSLQTITYNVTHLQKRDKDMPMNLSKTNLKSYKYLGDDLWNFKTIKSLEISPLELHQQLVELSKTNSWLTLAYYQVSSIVQGDSYARYFKEYNNILDIIWWRNLRLGNWKIFMNTLENYAYNNTFQLYTGTSDKVKYPNKQNANQNTILVIKNGFKNETIPAYIWTYLKSTDNRNRDFIIIGYNSPYAEFFRLNNIIFCPDICSEIPWLSDIHSSFHFATAGIMFCCSTDFIRQSNRLHGFPMNILQTDQLTNETEMEIATEIEVTSESRIDVNENTESILELNNTNGHITEDYE